jgi:glucose-6-phosphate isomerase
MVTLKYDYAQVLIEPGGLTQGQITELAGVLEAKRDEIFVEDLPAFAEGRRIEHKEPLDTAFVDLPQRLLSEYEQDRAGSELGRILSVSQRVREQVDRVVVLGIGGSYMGARALMDACCHPYHNELDRGLRGGRPRMYFEGNNVDNDACRGLLDVLPKDGSGHDPASRWALVVISKSGGTMETAVAFRLFLEAFRKATGESAEALAERVIPVTGTSGKLFELAKSLGCRDFFEVPDGVGGRFSVLSAVGLLPAALLGLDVVQLLRGAAAMTEHFRTASASENLVLQYTAVSHLMEVHQGATIRVLQMWSKTLECLGLWYDQLLAESLGKTPETGAMPLTVVNTRDLHSRAQQHQEGRRDKIYTNVIVDQWRTDPLVIPRSEHDQDQLNQLAGKSLPDIMHAAIKGTDKAYNDDHRPTASFQLPKVDEFHLGQFLQLMMLATVVEGRLLGINPYGQPGVEAYKVNMKQELGL